MPRAILVRSVCQNIAASSSALPDTQVFLALSARVAKSIRNCLKEQFLESCTQTQTHACMHQAKLSSISKLSVARRALITCSSQSVLIQLWGHWPRRALVDAGIDGEDEGHKLG